MDQDAGLLFKAVDGWLREGIDALKRRSQPNFLKIEQAMRLYNQLYMKFDNELPVNMISLLGSHREFMFELDENLKKYDISKLSDASINSYVDDLELALKDYTDAHIYFLPTYMQWKRRASTKPPLNLGNIFSFFLTFTRTSHGRL